MQYNSAIFRTLFSVPELLVTVVVVVVVVLVLAEIEPEIVCVWAPPAAAVITDPPIAIAELL